MQRTTNMIQRWDWWDRKKEERAKAAAAAKVKEDAEKAKQAEQFSGQAGKQSSATVEAVKPGASLGAAALSTGITSGVSGNTGFAGGAANAVLGPLMVGDALMGLNSADSMGVEAVKYKDRGMHKLAGRKAKDQGTALAMAGMSTAKAGVDIANVAGGTAKALGGAALGVAGGGLGIVSGSAMVLQGAWRGGQAVMKLCRLTWGRAQDLLSQAGEAWKRAVIRTEKFKVAVNGLKVALGVLGIAAGALLIVSNPIGWAVGIAAAVAGGVYAVGKIAAKIKNASDKDAARQKIDRQKIEGGTPVEQVDGDVPRLSVTPKNKASKRGTGFAKPVDENAAPPSEDQAKRKAAIDRANLVAREACANAKIADEMRQALSSGDKDLVAKSLEIKAADPEEKPPKMIEQPEDRMLHDAFQILTAINVNPDQALSDSGQDLIEKKLSKTDSM